MNQANSLKTSKTLYFNNNRLNIHTNDLLYCSLAHDTRSLNVTSDDLFYSLNHGLAITLIHGRMTG